ncbi:amino acid transporter [Subtercola boreus]|uniref:Amino acid transporter n=1 Tax=Subtercola boreus TaxID=120213 RepID=A0A3E0VWI9_9MICO|nr:amino acid transporter [Subtercola boreus]
MLGLLTGLSLIIAIGAQNAFVLRLGIEGQGRMIAVVVSICALSDAVLIVAGTLGIGALISAAPAVLVIIRIVGSGFLIVYGLFAAYRAFRPKALDPSASTDSRPATRLSTAALTALALTWLNPHVYLDTVIFLGSVANQQGTSERWWWVGGAILASFLWFFGLGFGARLLRPVFARPGAWRVLDALIAVVMLALGLRMALGA